MSNASDSVLPWPEGAILTAEQHWYAGHAVAITFCYLSVICSIFTIISFAIFYKMRNTFLNRLVVYIAINDLFGFAIHGSGHAYHVSTAHVNAIPFDGFCYLNAYALVVYSLVNPFLMVAFTYYTWKAVLLGKQAKNWPDWFYLIFSVLIPIFLGTIPLWNTGWVSYGPLYLWCDIQEATPYLIIENLPAFIVFWIILASVIGLIVYIRIKFSNVARRDDETSGNRDREQLKAALRLMTYPLAFLIQWLPQMIYSCVALTPGYDNNVLLVLEMMIIITWNCGGILNLMAFGVNTRLFTLYSKLIKGELNSDQEMKSQT